MTQCDRTLTGPSGRGRGTGKPSVSIPQTENRREEELVGGRHETGVPSVPRPLAFGGDPTRQWSKRGMPFVVIEDRAHLHHMATSRAAIALPVELRRAAAADLGLEWNPATHRYRTCSPATPAPPEASRGVSRREGASKVGEATPSVPAAASDSISMTKDPRILDND